MTTLIDLTTGVWNVSQTDDGNRVCRLRAVRRPDSGGGWVYGPDRSLSVRCIEETLYERDGLAREWVLTRPGVYTVYTSINIMNYTAFMFLWDGQVVDTVFLNNRAFNETDMISFRGVDHSAGMRPWERHAGRRASSGIGPRYLFEPDRPQE